MVRIPGPLLRTAAGEWRQARLEAPRPVSVVRSHAPRAALGLNAIAALYLIRARILCQFFWQLALGDAAQGEQDQQGEPDRLGAAPTAPLLLGHHKRCNWKGKRNGKDKRFNSDAHARRSDAEEIDWRGHFTPIFIICYAFIARNYFIRHLSRKRIEMHSTCSDWFRMKYGESRLDWNFVILSNKTESDRARSLELRCLGVSRRRTCFDLKSKRTHSGVNLVCVEVRSGLGPFRVWKGDSMHLFYEYSAHFRGIRRLIHRTNCYYARWTGLPMTTTHRWFTISLCIWRRSVCGRRSTLRLTRLWAFLVFLCVYLAPPFHYCSLLLLLLLLWMDCTMDTHTPIFMFIARAEEAYGKPEIKSSQAK